MDVNALLHNLKNIWKSIAGNGYDKLSSISETAATANLYDALISRQPDRLRKSLDQGANPYHQRAPYREPALVHIIRLNSLYTEKLDYVRPLVEAGGDFDRLRRIYKDPLDANASQLDGKILSLGDLNFREGDRECSAFLLAHLIEYDLKKGRSFTLPVDSVLAGIGSTTQLDPIQEASRWKAARSMTENQHALVDYVRESADHAAKFLRSHADHPDAKQWMAKMEPIDPDKYSRPKGEKSFLWSPQQNNLS